MPEEAAAVLARLDANVSNLIRQVDEVKAVQRDQVSRERLEIEVKARETEINRIQTEFALAREDGRKIRDDALVRIESLERTVSSLRGALAAVGFVFSTALVIFGYLIGHLYFK